ncbi:MAG: DNA translocase FtsK 4TM domain-containing protein [Verrucomicrobia bacterium]|nr:DNA translocase FtsK 4TM domain-containing protein [Verrucomicrobiota bacterium]
MASRKRGQRIEESSIEKRWEIIGITVVAFGVLLLLALLTYDKNDLLPSGSSDQTVNWIGIFGAYIARGFLKTFGLGAFGVPLIFIAWGLSIPISILKHLQRRWPWMVLLTLAFSCGADIHKDLFPGTLSANLSTMSPGGFVGHILNKYIFFAFGKVGATTILLTLYIISIISLTHVRLDEWIALILEKIQKLREEAQIRRKEAEKKAAQQKEKQLLLEAKKKAEEDEERKRKEEESRSEAKEEDVPFEEETPVPEPEKGTYKIIDAYSADKLAKKTSVGILSSPNKSGDYHLPSIDLLAEVEPYVQKGDEEEEMITNADRIRQTLAEFNLEVKPGNITRGPTVTLYEFLPAKGIRMSKITTLNDNLLAALKALSIHILAPIPGKNSVGIEVPNRVKIKVVMRELLESPEWINSNALIPIALGKDIYGKPIVADLAEMPHLLVAGSTGSGKSVCINAIVASLLYKFSPEELRFVMVDPKVVELQQYNNLPHMIVPVVTDPKKVVLTLKWVVSEMEKRYKIFAKVGARNIKGFNSRKLKTADEIQKKIEQKPGLDPSSENVPTEGVAVELDKEISVPRDEELVIPDRLSYIILIIDELADLMLVAGKEVETLITRITQMARAAGIHCVVATQRPSVDVVTGVIKSNIPTRIAFQVADAINSRTILDCMGAEKLLGKGDMLFLPPGSARTTRIQGALITDNEITSILDFITEQAKPNFFEDFLRQLSQPNAEEGEQEDDEDEDLIQKSVDVIYTRNRASVSMLQRDLKLGYNRAARIMEILERRGIVGPSRGSKDREIL